MFCTFYKCGACGNEYNTDTAKRVYKPEVPCWKCKAPKSSAIVKWYARVGALLIVPKGRRKWAVYVDVPEKYAADVKPTMLVSGKFDDAYKQAIRHMKGVK